ncbi:hypothetical protein [Maritalea myrionectae]|uniref:hypothetical protein n=1 Tax=Maritalea myrionectae TaxID=454601 RepID=UPI00040AE9EA|nr:hypothetical protein [Maritalea myrionectae]
MNFLKIALLVIGAAMLFACGGVNQAVWKECKARPGAMADYVAKAERLGFLVKESGWKANEREWRTLSHNQKINVAVAVYCSAADEDGRANVSIRGYRSGDVLATIVDGHYSD